MEIILKGKAKEIAALALALQERREGDCPGSLERVKEKIARLEARTTFLEDLRDEAASTLCDLSKGFYEVFDTHIPIWRQLAEEKPNLD